MSLSHSQIVAQELGVMHQVSYSSFLSTSCRNAIKDRNYEAVLLIAVWFISRQKKNSVYTLQAKRVWYGSYKNVFLLGR